MKIYNFLMILFLAGCASAKRQMPGEYASLIAGDEVAYFKVSSQVDEASSLENYKLVNIYFRNLGQHWLRVKNIEIIEVEKDLGFSVLAENDVNTYLRSLRHNHKLLVENAKEGETVEPLNAYEFGDYLTKPFAIPSGLQTPKWVILLLKNPKAQWLKMKIKFIDTYEQVYQLRIK